MKEVTENLQVHQILRTIKVDTELVSFETPATFLKEESALAYLKSTLEAFNDSDDFLESSIFGKEFVSTLSINKDNSVIFQELAIKAGAVCHVKYEVVTINVKQY